MSITLEKEQLKQLIKESVTEVLEERIHLLEELEDKLLLEAIKAGENTDSVPSKEVFAALHS